MRISLIQSDIIWEHKNANLLFYESLLSGLTGKTDLAVLPEMCTTGFSMNPELLAETMEGETITAFKRMAANFGYAIAGTFIGKEASNSGRACPAACGGVSALTKFLSGIEDSSLLAARSFNCYNRAFFIQPDGQVDFYDKKHLFRLGDEGQHYASGKTKKIVIYLGWNIRLAVCYELRFPVWLRTVKNDYDLLLLMANWPESRQHVWTSLLTARALENQAYVCGVNRVGTDANGIVYAGGSQLVNAYGTTLTDSEQEGVCIKTLDLNLEELHRFRRKFPVWKDADSFEISS